MPKGAWFPFGAGTRICLGESFAWTEAVLALAVLVPRWAPTPDPARVVRTRAAVTLRPSGGLPVTAGAGTRAGVSPSAAGTAGRMKPSLVVLDVNETLSDTAPLAARFTDLGLPAHIADLWFASVLREGFALTALGAAQPFAEVARGVLSQLLPDDLDAAFDDAVEHVLSAFSSLDVHPDVVPGLQAMAAAGLRVVTLSNGSVDGGRGRCSTGRRPGPRGACL